MIEVKKITNTVFVIVLDESIAISWGNVTRSIENAVRAALDPNFDSDLDDEVPF